MPRDAYIRRQVRPARCLLFLSGQVAGVRVGEWLGMPAMWLLYDQNEGTLLGSPPAPPLPPSSSSLLHACLSRAMIWYNGSTGWKGMSKKWR